jgi:inosose dehydratase
MLHAAGQYIQLTGTKCRDFTAEDRKREGQLLTELGKQVAVLGLQAALHNHMGSIAETPEQIDAVPEASDPRYVKLLLDVGHYFMAGGNPATAIRKYGDRIALLHLKDVIPSTDVTARNWVELGRGAVDLPQVFAALHEIGFKGWAIVELDSVPQGSGRTPKECALISREYLTGTLELVA